MDQPSLARLTFLDLPDDTLYSAFHARTYPTLFCRGNLKCPNAAWENSPAIPPPPQYPTRPFSPLPLLRSAPLAWAAGTLALGLLLEDRLALPGWLWLCLAAAIGVASLFLRRREKVLAAWILVLLLLVPAAALLLSMYRHPARGHVSRLSLPLRSVAIEGLVFEAPAPSSSRAITQLLLSLNSISIAEGPPQPITGRVRVTLNWRAADFRYGQLVRILGTLRAPGPPTNPGQADFRVRCRSQGIHALLSCWDPRQASILAHAQGSPVKAGLLAAREWAIGRLHCRVGPPESELLASMLFGVRGRISQTAREDFQATGMMHILVTSGLHVGLLTWMILGLLASLKVPRPAATWFALLGLALYVGLCGGRPPLLRSSLMFAFLVGAQIFGRRHSPFNAIGAAALLVLFLKPEALWDPSFQFSFSATLAIFCFVPWLIAHRGPIPLLIAQVGGCTLAAQLALLPLLAFSFQSVPLLGAFANLIVIPALGSLLGAGLFLVFLGWVPLLGEFVGVATKFLLEQLAALISFFAGLPLASTVLPPLDAFSLTAYLSWALGGLLWINSARRKKRPGPPVPTGWLPYTLCLGGAAALAARVWWAALAPLPGTLSLTFLDVGQGSALVIRLPSGRTILRDAGPVFAGPLIVTPALKAQGIGRLAAAIFTHPHADHIGGLPAVLRMLKTDVVLMTGIGFSGGAEFAQLRAALASPGLNCRLVGRGTFIEGEAGVEIGFISPPLGGATGIPRSGLQDENSAVMAIRFGETSALLTADITSRMERRLIPDLVSLGREVLMEVPHHGSAYASSAEFLAALAPRHAVVSAGAYGRSPHPHPATLIRLLDQGARVWVTARHGAVTATSDGRRWRVVPHSY